MRDSSLSACTQAVMAAWTGHLDLAFDYLAEAALVDLNDLAGNSDHGVHIASMAGTWTAVVVGFGGMQCDSDGLRFAPRLPPALSRISFGLQLARPAAARRDPPGGGGVPAGGRRRRCGCRHHGEQVALADAPAVRPIPPAETGRAGGAAVRQGAAGAPPRRLRAIRWYGRRSLLHDETCGEGDRWHSTSGSTSAGSDVAGDVPATGSSTSGATSRCSTNGSTAVAPRPPGGCEEVLHDETVGTPQALTERDVAAGIYTDRLAALRAAEHGLAFGRLDAEDGEVRYVGRLGLLDEDDEYNSLLMDWRAPAARPFYTATAASPEGIRRRRHLRTRRRDGHRHRRRDPRPRRRPRRRGRPGERAHQRGRAARRGGREPHRADGRHRRHDPGRAGRDHPVEAVRRARRAGRAGTGKTAVALHRAAYLLYTHRDRLARRGVLVIGPNPTFLRYIGQVLPSLGETSVVLAHRGQLFPGLDARRAEPPEVAEVKGRAEMAGVIAAAVRDRQQLPRRPVRAGCGAAGGAGRPGRRGRSPRPRPPLPQAAQRRQADLPPGGDPAAGRAGRALDRARWAAAARRGRPRRDPRRAEGEPRARPRARRALAHPVGRAASRRPLRRPAPPGRGHPAPARRRPGAAGAAVAVRGRAAGLCWTPADVPLLDEAAELLGDDGAEAAAREAAALREEVMYAQGVLDVLDLEEDLDSGAAARHRMSSTPTGSPNARPCAATTRRPTAPPPTASGPTGT